MASISATAGRFSALNLRRRGWLVRVAGPLLFAVAVFALLLLAYGKNPFSTYYDILKETFGSTRGFTEMLVVMIPLTFTALAVAIPARVGTVNVGGEGQLLIGAIFASFVALNFTGLPIGVMIPLMMFAAFLGGGLWAAVPAFLRARGWLNEVISTLLLNFVAGFLLQYLVFGVWKDPASSNFPQSKPFVHAAVLPGLGVGRLHIGIIFAFVSVVLFWLVLKKTRWGYEMRAIGGNPEASRRSGIPIGWYIVGAFFVGGGLAGLAGLGEASAIQGRLRPGLSPGYGFIGFLVSWMAGHNPVLVVFMSFLLAVITSGRDVLQITQGLPGSAVNILMALILFVILAQRAKKAEAP